MINVTDLPESLSSILPHDPLDNDTDANGTSSSNSNINSPFSRPTPSSTISSPSLGPSCCRPGLLDNSTIVHCLNPVSTTDSTKAALLAHISYCSSNAPGPVAHCFPHPGSLTNSSTASSNSNTAPQQDLATSALVDSSFLCSIDHHRFDPCDPCDTCHTCDPCDPCDEPCFDQDHIAIYEEFCNLCDPSLLHHLNLSGNSPPMTPSSSSSLSTQAICSGDCVPTDASVCYSHPAVPSSEVSCKTANPAYPAIRGTAKEQSQLAHSHSHSYFPQAHSHSHSHSCPSVQPHFHHSYSHPHQNCSNSLPPLSQQSHSQHSSSSSANGLSFSECSNYKHTLSDKSDCKDCHQAMLCHNIERSSCTARIKQCGNRKNTNNTSQPSPQLSCSSPSTTCHSSIPSNKSFTAPPLSGIHKSTSRSGGGHARSLGFSDSFDFKPSESFQNLPQTVSLSSGLAQAGRKSTLQHTLEGLSNPLQPRYSSSRDSIASHHPVLKKAKYDNPMHAYCNHTFSTLHKKPNNNLLQQQHSQETLSKLTNTSTLTASKFEASSHPQSSGSHFPTEKKFADFPSRKRPADDEFQAALDSLSSNQNSSSQTAKNDSTLYYCHWGDNCDAMKFATEIDFDFHLKSEHLKSPFSNLPTDRSVSVSSTDTVSDGSLGCIPSSGNSASESRAAIDNKSLVCNWDSCNLELTEFESLLQHIKKDHVSSFSKFPHSECSHSHDHDTLTAMQDSKLLPEHSKDSQEPSKTQLQDKNSSESYNLQCLWDSCGFNTESADLFDSHLLNMHLNPMTLPSQYDDNENQASNAQYCSSSDCLDKTHEHALKNGVSMFQCEWKSCNFKVDNLNDFTSHVRQNHTLNAHESAALKSSGTDGVEMNKELSSLYPMLSSDLDSKAQENNIKILPKPLYYESAKPEPGIKHQHSSSEHTQDCDHDHASTDGPAVCQWLCTDPDTQETHECGKVFSDAAELTAHISEDHVGFRKNQYVCMWAGCDRHGRPFAQRQKITRHLQTHTKNKPFKCEVCGNSFAEEAVLRQHMRIHSGERPFECKVCGKKFAASTALSVHLRTHTGEKPLACKWPGCGKRFSESSNLAKHMKTHMAERPFACPVDGCGKRFGRNDQLQRHLKTHEKRMKKAAAQIQQAVN